MVDSNFPATENTRIVNNNNPIFIVRCLTIFQHFLNFNFPLFAFLHFIAFVPCTCSVVHVNIMHKVIRKLNTLSLVPCRKKIVMYTNRKAVIVLIFLSFAYFLENFDRYVLSISVIPYIDYSSYEYSILAGPAFTIIYTVGGLLIALYFYASMKGYNKVCYFVQFESLSLN